jgi:hypothetical protein
MISSKSGFSSSIEDYERFIKEDSTSEKPLKNRGVVLNRSGHLKEISDQYSVSNKWKVSNQNTAKNQAHREVVKNFQSALEKKYGTGITNFVLSKSQLNNNSSFLSFNNIKVVLEETKKLEDLFNKNSNNEIINDEIEAIHLKTDQVSKIIQEIQEKLSSVEQSDDHLIKKELLSKEVFIEQKIKNCRLNIKETKKTIKEIYNTTLKFQGEKNSEAWKKEMEVLLGKCRTSSRQASLECKEILGIQHGVQEEIVDHSSSNINELPPCEDFPEPGFYNKLLGDIYKKRCSVWETLLSHYYISENLISEKYRGIDPLKKIAGFTGLSNHTGNCAINSALQLMKTALQGIADYDSQAWENLSSKIEAKMPYLLKFLNNQIDTEDDGKELRKEVARSLTEDLWYSHMTHGLGVSEAALQEGHFTGANTVSTVAILLHRLQLPPVVFEQTISGKKEHTRHASQVINFDIQDQKYCTSNSFFYQNSINNVLNKKFNRQGRVLDDPLPAILCINRYGLFNTSNVLEKITLPHKNGGFVTYQPKSISCFVRHEGRGHTFAIVKKDSTYYELNDDGISSVPKEWQNSLKNYCDQYAEVIIYEKQQTNKEQADNKKITNITATTPDITQISHTEQCSFLKAEYHKKLPAYIVKMDSYNENRMDLEVALYRAFRDDKSKKKQAQKIEDFLLKQMTICNKVLEKDSAKDKIYWENSLQKLKNLKRSWDMELSSV